MEKISEVSCIIPTMDGREHLLMKLLWSMPTGCEKIIVRDMDILLAAKRNKGARAAKGEYLLFIDDDNHLLPGAIEKALAVAKLEKVGVVGLMACYHDRVNYVADGGSKRNYLTGFTSGVNTNAHWPSISKEPYEVDEVANAFMVHCELFYELHGFDEKNFPIDLDEADLCKRIKNLGYKVMMCPTAVCFHHSQTYSPIPDFRRPLNAYFMGRNRQRFQRINLNALSYWVYLVIFCPIFICFYSAALLYRKKPRMLWHFLRGVWDGTFGCFKNPYQPSICKKGGRISL